MAEEAVERRLARHSHLEKRGVPRTWLARLASAALHSDMQHCTAPSAHRLELRLPAAQVRYTRGHG